MTDGRRDRAKGDRTNGDAPDRPRRSGERLPPHNLDAEASLLGAVLLSKDAFLAVVETGLTADDFYKPAHQHIYDAARTLVASGEPVDLVTVAEELRRADLLDLAGGREYLVDLQIATPMISNAARYARIVQDTAVLRRLIRVASEIAEIGFDEPDDVSKALSTAESKVFEIAERRVVDSTRPINELIKDAFEDLEKVYEQGNIITGTPTGYTDLDELLSGLQPSTLNVVGARPAMGKTAFALGMATNVAVHAGLPVLLFSLEMGHKELTQRILASEARIDSTKLRTGRLTQQDWSAIGKAIGRLEAPLYIDDNPYVTVSEIGAKSRRLAQRFDGKLGLIVIDYLQLMTGRTSAENRQVEISEISRGLKVLARELRTPIVALSQLSRALESRADKRPMLADLRESGAIEQDADVVMFIYRDEVYNPESPDRGSAEIIVAKHRNGPIGMKRLAFLGQYTKFHDMARGL
jgi:replicative DNA helicase